MREWLTWTVNEFSLKNVDFHKFSMDGATLCALGKECFLDLAPDFVGDILWEHLEMLQKGENQSVFMSVHPFIHACTIECSFYIAGVYHKHQSGSNGIVLHNLIHIRLGEDV